MTTALETELDALLAATLEVCGNDIDNYPAPGYPLHSHVAEDGESDEEIAHALAILCRARRLIEGRFGGYATGYYRLA